jgi:CrcB protein
MRFLLIAGGGACGALLRYGLAALVTRWHSGSFPLATLTINVTGCFVFGLLGFLLITRAADEFWRFALLTGFLAAYTTFATFSWETLHLLRDGDYLRAAAYVVLSNLLGLAALWCGYRVAEAWL